MGAVDYTPAEVERVPANGQAATIQRSQPIFTPNYTLSINGVVAKCEHIVFPFFDDNGYIQLGLALPVGSVYFLR